MNRFGLRFILAIVSLVSFASAAPPTRPASGTDASIVAGAAPLGNEYELLIHRSIFIKGRQATVEARDGGASTEPSAPANPEDTMVFNGVTETDHQIVAFIEDTSAGKVGQYSVGDSIARGKIVDISLSLDSIEYESGGKRVEVQIGQNLSGVDVMTMPSAPTSAATGPESEIMERLRRRRQAELGH